MSSAGRKKVLLKGLGITIALFFIFALILYFYGARQLGDTTPFIGTGRKIAILEIKGIIKDSKDIIILLDRYSKDKGVRAIVLRIDSPGGTVGSSQEIYEEVKKVKRRKKVVASLGSMATSGAYYIASASDKIVANPGTITGSISVAMEFPQFKKLLEKIGVKGMVIKSGPYKDIGSPLREMKREEKELLQEVVNDIHMQFVRAVAKSRELPVEKVKTIADGRIFSGLKAKELNLVDALGNLNDAIKIAAKLAGIKGKPRVVYARKRRRFSLKSLIFGENYMAGEGLLTFWPFINYICIPGKLF